MEEMRREIRTSAMGLLGLTRVHLSRKLPLAKHVSQCRPGSQSELNKQVSPSFVLRRRRKEIRLRSGGETGRRRRRAEGSLRTSAAEENEERRHSRSSSSGSDVTRCRRPLKLPCGHQDLSKGQRQRRGVG